MKFIKLIGLTAGASIALASVALAQDIPVAVASSMTGSELLKAPEIRSAYLEGGRHG